MPRVHLRFLCHPEAPLAHAALIVLRARNFGETKVEETSTLGDGRSRFGCTTLEPGHVRGSTASSCRPAGHTAGRVAGRRDRSALRTVTPGAARVPAEFGRNVEPPA